MQVTNNSDSEIIIAQNKEEWGRLLFLLQDPEPNVFWINCDTAWVKRPLHDAIGEHFPQLKSYDIYLNERTESLTRIILLEEKDEIPKEGIIHVFGLEDAVKSSEFISNLNFQRNTLFRKTPVHLIFWTDFATGTILSHKAYDFWSWIVFTFNFKTPDVLLTSRQKGFQNQLRLENTAIDLPDRDSKARISHLENEWEEFLKSVNGRPSTIKQMNDAITIARAMALEYRDDGHDSKAIEILEHVFRLNPEIITEKDQSQLWNDLGVSYFELGTIEKARDLYENALSLNIKLFGENNLEVVTNKSNLAGIYKSIGEFQTAKKLLEESLATFNEISGKNHPYLDTLESNLAMVYEDLGELDKAKVLLEKALDNNLKRLGENHPDTAIKLSNLGVNHYKLGDMVKAKDLFEKALNSDLKNFDKNHPNIAIRYYNLAYTFLGLNQISKAREYMAQALGIYRNLNHGKEVEDCLSFLKSLEPEPPPTSSSQTTA